MESEGEGTDMVKWLGFWTFLIVLMVPWDRGCTIYAHDKKYNPGAPGRRRPTRAVFAPGFHYHSLGKACTVSRSEVSDGKQMEKFIVDGISKSDRISG